MRAVRRQHTTPEWAVRRLLHSAGYRYRLHVRGLPGSPDIVFAKRRAAIFVHGCFWHGHDCRPSLSPASRKEFWEHKVARNQARDQAAVEALNGQGWRVLCVWECETRKRDQASLTTRLVSFLGPPVGGNARRDRSDF